MSYRLPAPPTCLHCNGPMYEITHKRDGHFYHTGHPEKDCWLFTSYDREVLAEFEAWLLVLHGKA